MKAEGESAVIISKLAEYCMKVRDVVSAELSADFGDTPSALI